MIETGEGFDRAFNLSVQLTQTQQCKIDSPPTIK